MDISNNDISVILCRGSHSASVKTSTNVRNDINYGYTYTTIPFAWGTLTSPLAQASCGISTIGVSSLSVFVGRDANSSVTVSMNWYSLGY